MITNSNAAAIALSEYMISCLLSDFEAGFPANATY